MPALHINQVPASRLQSIALQLLDSFLIRSAHSQHQHLQCSAKQSVKGGGEKQKGEAGLGKEGLVSDCAGKVDLSQLWQAHNVGQLQSSAGVLYD